MPGCGAQLIQQACHPEQQACLEDGYCQAFLPAWCSHRAMRPGTLKEQRSTDSSGLEGGGQGGRVVGLFPEKVLTLC